MKSLNVFSDVAILSRKMIQVRNLKNDKEIVVLKGEDIEDLSCLIARAWKYGVDVESSLELFFPRYSRKQIKETFHMLESLGLLVDSRKDFLDCDLFYPFSFVEIAKDTWMFRKGLNVLVFKTAKNFCISDYLDFFARRYKSDEDISLFSCFFQDPDSVNFFPAKNVKKTEMKKLLVNSINCLSDYHIQSFSINWNKDGEIELISNIPDLEFSRSNFAWKRLLDNLLRHPFLVPDVKKATAVDKSIFSLEGFAYSASHGRVSLEGSVFDDIQLGTGSTEVEACGKAAMEAVERYCGRSERKEDTVVCASDLEEESFIHPGLFAKHSSIQYENRDLCIRPFNEKEVIGWTEIKSLDGKITHVPSELVYYSYTQDSFPDGRALFWSNSSGVAAHRSLRMAIESAALELIERDAIMIWWLNKISPPRISKNFFSKKISKTIFKLEANGFEIEILDLTLDLFPVAMCVARNKNKEYPYFFCGAASALDFSVAVEKALSELELSIWAEIQEKKKKVIKDKFLLSDPVDHGVYFFNPQKGEFLDFLFEGEILNSHKSEKLKTGVKDLLKIKGLELFYKDITTQDVKSLDVGIVVVRVLIPTLIPISFGYMSEPLGMERIYEVPIRLGLRNEKLSEKEIIENYQPHFFP